MENQEILEMIHNSENDFFAAGIFYTFDTDSREIKFLVVNYRRDGIGPLQIKFPGGCSKEGESPFENLVREMKTETGLFPAQNEAEIIQHQIFPPKKNSGAYNVHHKVFFLIGKAGGILKTVSSADAGEVSPPFWMSAQNLSKVIFPGHKLAFKRACELLSFKKRDYAYALMNV
ncbi:MAG: NUDIX hydrolase [Candidatus Pacebacteria bacterium]|nr:NUDIX hydrolase [Candidatus Paceibacterota bacterium]MCD8508346.1 NUDIX hydrolase [Candidatus Paceibacterota bacterium]